LDERVPFDLKGARNGVVAGGREATGLAVRVTGLPAVARRVHADRRAGILLYHSPTPETLERHLDYLSRRHAFVSYDAIATAVATGDWSNVPPKSLAVTFDDGHASNAGLIELLERFGIRPTIFICTEIVGTRRRFWWNVDGLDPRERDRLMKIPDAERLAFLEGRSGWTPTRDYDGEAQTLTLEQIAALAERVDFQAHTRSHPILPMCADHQAEDEIAGSKRDVERLRDGPCLDFAYPNGRYGRRELELVARAGFRSARTIRTGWNDPYTDPYQLRVIGMPDNASLNVVAAQSTGIRGLRELMYIS
jgi:peptidoglycan/xylan/chitin deacetylase (PgdA/CDA1 family)